MIQTVKIIQDNMRTTLSMLIIPLMIACNSKEKEKSVIDKHPAKDTVIVFKLTAGDISKSVNLPAELLPYEQAELYGKVEGFVKSMKVDIGDEVKKGQVLAIVEAPELNTKFQEFQSSLSAAMAKYASSKDQYERLFEASQASTAGIVAPVDLTRAMNQMLADSSSYIASKNLAQSYKEMAGYLSISAPFNGLITSRKTDPGDLVGTNTMLLAIQDIRILRLRVSVPEIYETASSSKQIDFSVDAYPNQQFKAFLARKSETIDPGTRTELWEFDYDNSKRLLKAGSFAYVQLKLARKSPTFVVPFSAIVTNQEKRFVIRVRDNKAEWIDVRQGFTTDKGIEIFGPVLNSDTLVLQATDELKPGSQAIWKGKG
jgi:membrane fusion protein (multidrug efflux system)